MAGYVYCMSNNHYYYGRFVKIGYTEKTVETRRVGNSNKWHCKFEVLWEIPVYDAILSERYIHDVFFDFRKDYEFFDIDPAVAKQIAEKLLDENWREIEGKDTSQTDLDIIVSREANGFIVDQGAYFNDSDREPDAD